MADIIQFTPRGRDAEVSAGSEPAAVIIFPGVRYERAAGDPVSNDDPPQIGERPGRRGKRRRLS